MNLTQKSICFWISWLTLAILVLGVLQAHRWQAYANFLTNPLICKDDARQQIIPYMQPRFDLDYTSLYQREIFTPIGVHALYSLSQRWFNADLVSRYTGLITMLLTIGFSGAAAWRLAGPWASLAAMAYLISSSGTINTSLNGLPRSFALPLIASGLWAASYQNWRKMSAITVLGGFLYPVATFLLGLWLSVCMCLNSGARWHWRPSLSKRQIIMLAITAIASIMVILPGRWHNESYGRLITPAMFKEFPEAGPHGRFGHSYFGMSGQSFTHSLNDRVYSAIAGKGTPLFPRFYSYASLKANHSTHITIAIVASIALGLVCLSACGHPYATFIAFSASISVCAGYIFSYYVMPYGYYPDRYIKYSTCVLIPVFLACALEGYASFITQPLHIFRFLKPLVRIVFFALPIVMFGNSGSHKDNHGHYELYDIRTVAFSPQLKHALRALPDNSILAGWPDDEFDNGVFYARKPIWLHFEGHQAYHTLYVLELRRRMYELIDAMLSPNPKALQKLRDEGVTHVLIHKSIYRSNHAPHYFSPFSTYLRHHWKNWHNQTPAISTLPKTDSIYEDRQWELVRLPSTVPAAILSRRYFSQNHWEAFMVRIAIAFCCSLLIAFPTLACGVMDKSEPKVGSTVESTDHLSLTFTQAFVAAASNVEITDTAGNIVKADKPVSSEGDTVISLKTIRPLTPGTYKVSWNLLWLDCNSKTQGDYKFTVKPY